MTIARFTGIFIMAKRKFEQTKIEPAAGAAAPRRRKVVSRIFSEIAGQYRACGAWQKVLVWVLLASHLPHLIVAVNSLPLDFDVGTCAYQHMGMAARIVDHKPMYTGPNSEHSVVTYTPLYWIAIAMLSKIFGLTFTLARMVSLLSALGVWGVVFAFVWKNTDRNLCLSIAAPAILFASSPMILDWPLDINVNAFHYAFVLGGFIASASRCRCGR